MIRAMNQAELRRAQERKAANKDSVTNGIIRERIEKLSTDWQHLSMQYSGVRPSWVSAELSHISAKINKLSNQLDGDVSE